jgi:hypothetical protein
VSTVGTINGQVTYLSANTVTQNIGSPGTAINAVPEPTSLATLACGGLLGLGFAARRRRQA